MPSSAEFASAASTGRPTTSALTPSGGSFPVPGGSISARIASISCFCSSNGITLIPNAITAVSPSSPVSGSLSDHGLREVRRQERERPPNPCLVRRLALAAEQVRKGDRRAQLRVLLAAGRGLAGKAGAGEDALLVVAHPRDHLGVGEVRRVHRDVDLAGDPGRLLELVDVLELGQVAGDELTDVGDHLGPGSQRPTDHRDDEAHGQHPAGRRDRCGQGPPAERTGPLEIARRAWPMRSSAAISGAGRRSLGGGRLSRPVSDRVASPAVSASANAIAIPATSSRPNPRSSGSATAAGPRSRRPWPAPPPR